MPIQWQVTELSTKDADGNYQDDLSAGIGNIVGFALDIFVLGSAPVPIVIASVVATLWRYREPYEMTGPTVARRVQVGGNLANSIVVDNVNITIPANTMLIDQSYQLRIAATDDAGQTWVRTREYRAVAG